MRARSCVWVRACVCACVLGGEKGLCGGGGTVCVFDEYIMTICVNSYIVFAGSWEFGRAILGVGRRPREPAYLPLRVLHAAQETCKELNL